MSDFSDSLRKESNRLAAASIALRGSDDFETNLESQLMFVVGQVNAHHNEKLADLCDYLQASENVSERASKLKQVSDFHNKLRMAAASNNWTEYDRLIDEYTSSRGDGGSQPEQP